MSTISNILSAPPANFSTTLSSNISNNDLTIPLNSVTGLGTEGVGVIYEKDSDGNPVAGSMEFVHWTNTSGNNLTLTDTDDRGITGSASGAQAHNAGDTFEVWIHPEYYPNSALQVVLDTDGNAVNTTNVVTPTGTQTLTNKTLTSPTINSGTLATPTLTTPTIQTRWVAKGEYDNGNSGASKEIDWANGDRQKVTLTDNCTFTYANAAAGQVLTLRLIQDAGGTNTVTLPTSLWPGGSAGTFSTGANDIDLLIVQFDGTNYLTQLAADFS